MTTQPTLRRAWLTIARVAIDLWCARPIIERVLRETSGQSAADVRKSLHDAYPFGQRQYHPYKVWCDEIARQQGRKPALGTRGVKRLGPVEADPRQVDMFEGVG